MGLSCTGTIPRLTEPCSGPGARPANRLRMLTAGGQRDGARWWGGQPGYAPGPAKAVRWKSLGTLAGAAVADATVSLFRKKKVLFRGMPLWLESLRKPKRTAVAVGGNAIFLVRGAGGGRKPMRQHRVPEHPLFVLSWCISPLDSHSSRLLPSSCPGIGRGELGTARLEGGIPHAGLCE